MHIAKRAIHAIAELATLGSIILAVVSCGDEEGPSPSFPGSAGTGLAARTGTQAGANGLPVPGMVMMGAVAGSAAGSFVPTAGTRGAGTSGSSASGAGGTGGLGNTGAGGMGAATAGSTAPAGGAGGRAGTASAGSGGGGGMWGAAGQGGTSGSGSPSEDECGPVPTQPVKATTVGRVRREGFIEYDARPPNSYISLRTQLLVPKEPPPSGVVFLWPGLQPLGGPNFQPIGNGVLQPVLTWGQSCAPGAPPGHASWWISPQYVNVSTSERGYRGCYGGPVIATDTAHQLALDFQLNAPKWVQKVVDLQTQKSSEYALDMKGQTQGRALFVIELPNNAKPTEDILFTRTVLTMAMPDPSACEPIAQGMRDFASKARVSADGKHCCIDRIVLRAPGVMATTMDP